MLKSFSIKLKLFVMVLFSSLMLSSLSIGAWSTVSHLNKDVERLTGVSVPKLTHLSNMRYFGSEVTRLYLRVTTFGLPQTEVTRLKGKLEEHIKLYKDAEALYLVLPADQAEKQLFAAQDEKWVSTLELMHEGVGLIGNKNPAAIARSQDLTASLVAKAKVAHNTAFQSLQDYQTQVSSQWRDDADRSAKNGLRFLLILSLVGVALNMVCGILFARYLSRALLVITDRLRREAIEVMSAADAIAASSLQISSGVTEQAASLEQTAASMNEITAMVGNSASSALRSRSVAGDSQASAATGKEVMQSVLNAIGEIDQSNKLIMTEVDRSNHQIGEIVKVIETIRERTQVINDIVFQTKLLSFNASVEAARAGESGKGFAVVADEVGKLAQMSGAAAKEISSLLTDSLEKVRSTISQSQDTVSRFIHSGSQKIESGVTIANRGQEVLQTLVSNVAIMENLINEISGATEEQSKGLVEINSAITQLDNVTQVNSGAAEESAASADSLRSQAQELYRIIAELNHVITGKEEKAA